jgi:MFS family permease
MKSTLELLRRERSARIFFAAHAQSSFGTGASYVALLLIAYERFRSPWAIACVLLAELVPAMALGPVLGAAADRWSRKRMLIVAEAVRAVAFAGLALVGSFEATIALALAAGAGNALFNPTVMAALPGLVKRERFAAATSLYGAIAELGYTAGPALAAASFLFVGPETLMLVNGASFALSGAAIAAVRLDAHAADRRPAAPAGLLREAWAGLAATASHRGVRTLLLASSGVVACLGMVNVGELLLAREALGVGDAGFSVLVAAMGVGISVGSLLGSSGGAVDVLKRRYLGGLLLCGAALAASGIAPTFAVALPAFAAAGLGNGVALVYERLLLQTVVPDALLGRVFGVKNALVSWSFAVAFVSAGGLAALLGPRALFILAGAGTVAAWAAAGVALRGAWSAQPEIAPAHGSLREPAALEAIAG